MGLGFCPKGSGETAEAASAIGLLLVDVSGLGTDQREHRQV